MKRCIYSAIFPHSTEVRCMVYSSSKRPDGKFWAHFPVCSMESCPFQHPELLEGAVFDKEECNKILERAKEKKGLEDYETLD